MSTSDIEGILTTLQQRTGKSFTAASFEARLRIQKSVYLLKALEFAPATQYSFSDYFHGPYSPDLAKDYYKLLDERMSRNVPHLAGSTHIPEAMILTIRKAVQKCNDFLEAVATIHSLATRYRNLPAEQIRALFESIKPRLADIFEEGWYFLREEGLVDAHT